MIRTLDRYVAREFIRLAVLFALAAPLLFVMGDWTDNLDRFSNRGIPVHRVALSYVYQMPMFVLWSLPIAALIATVFTVSNMTRHSELAAAKAGGISFFRTLAMLPVVGILLTGVALVLVELVPAAEQLRREVLGETTSTTDRMRNDFVYRSPSGWIYTVRRLDAGNRLLRGVTAERAGDASLPALHIWAENATYDSTGLWTLHEGYLRLFGDSPLPRQTFHFDEYRIAEFRETPEALAAVPKEPEEMRYAELGRFIESMERSGAEPRELKVERAQKISIPMAILVIIIFGAPLASGSGRGGAAYGIGVSLAITIIYMMLFRIAGAVGNTGALEPMLAAWLPNLIFLVAGMLLLLRVRT